MCKVLQVNRSTYYYESKVKESTDEITPLVINIFKASKNNYGTRKIKVKLKKALGFRSFIHKPSFYWICYKQL